jgi:AcrR family transcriptional regulator
MPGDDYFSVNERFNAGAPVLPVDPSTLEQMWTAMLQLLQTLPRNASSTIGWGALSLDPGITPQTPEQHMALTVRYTLLNAFVERGELAAYLDDEAKRPQLFAAAATFPFNKDDLAEAMFRMLLRNAPPQDAEKVMAEAKEAGYHPDKPAIVERFLQYLRTYDQ